VSLGGVAFVSAGELSATVPAGIGQGTYGLSVTDPSGRSSTAAAAYRVVSSAQNVAGFVIDPLDAQVAGIAFTVSISAVDAQGALVDGFSGTVTASDSSGSLTPGTLGPFAFGELTAQVTVAANTNGDVLTVQDGLGHLGQSNPFDVGPGAPTQLTFATAPLSLAVGACSARIDLALEDAVGHSATTPSAISVSLFAEPPEGLSFYADPTCDAGLSALSIPDGGAGASFFLASTRAGPVTLQAVPATLPSASQEDTLIPGPPTGVVFSSPAQQVDAGTCSAPAQLTLVDGFGNPSPAGQPLTLALAAAPPSGVTFHSDSACAVGVSSVDLAAGESQVGFWFSAASPGEPTLSASGTLPDGGPLAASQPEDVLP
jgi:hypothetical protein